MGIKGDNKRKMNESKIRLTIKDEMKNKISMALKDPMLQQGFEIICKENAELKKEVEKHKWNDIFLEDCADYDKKIAEEYTTLQERIVELEKENAELKEQVNEWLNAYSDTSLVKVLRDCIYKNEKLSSQEQQQLSAWIECAMDFGSNLDECADQLTKAKEIIKKFLLWENDWHNKTESKYQLLKEAVQFLSEVEK